MSDYHEGEILFLVILDSILFPASFASLVMFCYFAMTGQMGNAR